ncbi:MAG TPA: hypothetical protein VM103_00555 [Candidatus Paceibacterota bacterium]|nr:hypothetical protein [Candidatus Paceibacterota bacterium]
MENVVNAKEGVPSPAAPEEAKDQSSYQGTININDRILKQMKDTFKDIKPSPDFGKPEASADPKL